MGAMQIRSNSSILYNSMQAHGVISGTKLALLYAKKMLQFLATDTVL